MKITTKTRSDSALPLLRLMVLICLMVTGCSKDGGGDPPEEDDPQAGIPTISGISPTSGFAGTAVSITGSNFSSTGSQNAVTFNGSSATVTSATSTQLVVNVPTNATSGVVSVTVNGETATGPSFTVLTAEASLCEQNEILQNTVWEDLVPGDGVDFIVQCAISVKGNALLTIEPGVIIAFEGNDSGIFTSEGGGLNAVGTASDPIKFLGTSANKGVWKGVYFGSNHPENRLEYVTVMHAGRTASGQSGEIAAVQLSRGDESRGEIINCTITDNDGYGLYLTEESELESFTGNTLSDNEEAPVTLFFDQTGTLDANSNYQGNGKNYVEVMESDIEEDAISMALLNVPYRFVESRRYNIKNGLTIAPGNVLEFASGAGFRLGEQSSDCADTSGFLDATGTMSQPITFKGVTSGTGTWLGLGINSSSPNNKLIYCNISGGGSDGIYNASTFAANVTLQCDSRITIQNTTITQSGEFGIYILDEDAELENFQDNVLSDNDLAPVWIHLPQVDQLDAASSYGVGNGRSYIQVEGNAIKEADLTIKKLDVPYRIETDQAGRETYVERAITIEPGTILEFDTSAGLVLGSPGVDCIPTTGSLNAIGTVGEPIIFKGATEGQGTWLGIGINSSTSANQLNYCQISGGGSNQMYNAGGQGNIVMTCGSTLTLQNSLVMDSGGWGVDFVQGNNNLSQSDNTFSNNSKGNIAPN